jgi:hypothetical protein
MRLIFAVRKIWEFLSLFPVFRTFAICLGISIFFFLFEMGSVAQSGMAGVFHALSLLCFASYSVASFSGESWEISFY